MSLDHSFFASVLESLIYSEEVFFPHAILNVLIGNSRMKIYDWRRGVKSGGKNREVDMKEEMTKLRQYVGAESTFLIVDICPETGETSALTASFVQIVFYNELFFSHPIL